jgi:hypothetical protein
MPLEIETILRSLRKVRRTGPNKWNACCPVHQDDHPSMLVWVNGDRLMFHCSTGCDWKAIQAALGLSNQRVTSKTKFIEPPPIILNVNALMAKWWENTTESMLVDCGKELGVDPRALVLLKAAWADCYQAWAFPMYDGWGKPIGIRLRNSEGRKWAVGGSKAGLLIPFEMSTKGQLFITEGPTDCAAVLSWGFDCIGRPSCNDGRLHIIEYLRRHRRDVVILSNFDLKTLPDGKVIRPGQEGAERLADEIVFQCKSLKVILPADGIKDARAWLAAGGTRRDVEEMIGSRRNWRPARPK